MMDEKDGNILAKSVTIAFFAQHVRHVALIKSCLWMSFILVHGVHRAELALVAFCCAVVASLAAVAEFFANKAIKDAVIKGQLKIRGHDV